VVAATGFGGKVKRNQTKRKFSKGPCVAKNDQKVREEHTWFVGGHNFKESGWKLKDVSVEKENVIFFVPSLQFREKLINYGRKFKEVDR
jgi:hypothetical protein